MKWLRRRTERLFLFPTTVVPWVSFDPKLTVEPVRQPEC